MTSHNEQSEAAAGAGRQAPNSLIDAVEQCTELLKTQVITAVMATNDNRAEAGSLPSLFQQMLNIGDQETGNQQRTLFKTALSKCTELLKMQLVAAVHQAHSLDNAIEELEKETTQAAKQVLIDLRQKEQRTNDDRVGFTKCKKKAACKDKPKCTAANMNKCTSSEVHCAFCRKNNAQDGVTEVPLQYTKGLNVRVPAASCESAVNVVYLVVCLTCTNKGNRQTYVGQAAVGKTRWDAELGMVPDPKNEKNRLPGSISSDAVKNHLEQHIDAYWKNELPNGHQFIWVAPLELMKEGDTELVRKAAERFWETMLEPEMNRGV